MVGGSCPHGGTGVERRCGLSQHGHLPALICSHELPFSLGARLPTPRHRYFFSVPPRGKSPVAISFRSLRGDNPGNHPSWLHCTPSTSLHSSHSPRIPAHLPQPASFLGSPVCCRRRIRFSSLDRHAGGGYGNQLRVALKVVVSRGSGGHSVVEGRRKAPPRLGVRQLWVCLLVCPSADSSPTISEQTG